MNFCRIISGAMPCLSPGFDLPFPVSRWSTLWWRTLPLGRSLCSSCLSPCILSPRLQCACCINGKAPSCRLSGRVWEMLLRLRMIPGPSHFSPGKMWVYTVLTPVPAHPAPWGIYLDGNCPFPLSSGIFSVTVSSLVPSRIFFSSARESLLIFPHIFLKFRI